jgi:hypothetical protein
MARLHAVTATAFTYFSLLVTLLALYRLLRGQGLGPDFWGAVVIGEGLIVVQVLLGVILLIMGGAPARPIHFLYGALTALTWPAAYAYTHDQDERRQALTWTVVSVFLFALSLRAAGTAVG